MYSWEYFIIQMILTSQGHLSTAGGREGYLSIASTSGGYPFDSAEMTLVDEQSIRHNIAATVLCVHLYECCPWGLTLEQPWALP